MSIGSNRTVLVASRTSLLCGAANQASGQAIMTVSNTTTTTTTSTTRNAASSTPIASQTPTPNAVLTAMTPVTNAQRVPNVARSGPTTGIGVRNDASVG